MSDFKKNLQNYFKQQEELFTDEFFFDKKVLVDEGEVNISLEELEEQVKQCRRCELWKTRTNTVFGAGNPDADLLFIGEAPGYNEDIQGEPFVGKAGKLLDKILLAINTVREDVFIANILKCRPPNNRTPHSDEIEKCEPYLLTQIQIIKPKLIICLGLVAAKTLLRVEYNLQQMRGRIYNYHGVDLMVTYHPAALLRNPNLKKFAWEDFQKIQKLYIQK
ncbi:MAG: uracil-DNA glycosylase [Candidatus Neomarinimicrobiota bacterium]|nr:MAG: uracil-DNA glycosylase [Candidatus Neomarinimicrobiota bacterium]